MALPHDACKNLSVYIANNASHDEASKMEFINGSTYLVSLLEIYIFNLKHKNVSCRLNSPKCYLPSEWDFIRL